MEETQSELISMADIGRLAGQSRATVGNWKARNAGSFPQERGRSSRGPLYDRSEVTAWLERTKRVRTHSAEVATLWKLEGQLRGALSSEDSTLLLLLLLGVRAKASESDWRQLVATPTLDLHNVFGATVQRLFPFVGEIIAPATLATRLVGQSIAMLSSVERSWLATMADSLLEHAAHANSYRGESIIPASVRRLVVTMAEPMGKVYNPSAGLGQLLIDAAVKCAPDTQLFGQESNRRLWAMAGLNLAIHNVVANVALGDAFKQDHFGEIHADRVISVFLGGNGLPILDAIGDDAYSAWAEPGSNNKKTAWIQLCLARLGEKGRAVIVLPNNALFDANDSRIRQRIIEAGFLDAVIALPQSLFPSTAMASCVVVLTKGRLRVGGESATTLMVDLTAQKLWPKSRTSVLDAGLIEQVLDLYHRWAAGLPPKVDYAAEATFDDLAQNDFIIDPSRYLPRANAGADIDNAARTRSELTTSLDLLIRASSDADAKLKAILRVASR